MRDSLTNLHDREEFRRELDALLLNCATASSEQHAVMSLGINDFRDVLSALGHDTGDAILVLLAARLSTLTALGWCVARSSGDVFAVAPPTLFIDPVPLVNDDVDRVHALLVDPFVVANGDRVQLSASIGVAFGGAEASAGALMGNARIAMYRAKAEQLPWALYDAALDEPATTRLVRVAELRKAIATGEIEVHYQPIVELAGREAVSVEALARWRHPRRGLVAPAEFIGLSERCGLIHDLTRVVVSTVAEQVAVWAAAGRSLPCAVNLSVHSLIYPRATEELVDALTRLSGAVTVEITESVFADNRAIVVLDRLAAAGVPCAVDDFGTGYSSLAALKDLPVTTIKIDRAFSKDLERDDRDFALLKTIVEMAADLGLHVIAEGVESEACAARLRDAGVSYAQGFLFAPPMPIEELEAWLASAPHRTDASRTPTPVDGNQQGRQDVSAMEALQVLLDSTRALLRVDSAEQAVGALMRAVSDLGGASVPAIRAAASAIPIDISLGEADPLLPTAPLGSPARATLERLLPGLVEDAKVAADKAVRLARLSEQVDTDPLTGLANRRGLSRMRALHDTDAIAMVDLDHFKRVNDTYGHPYGDRLLVAFSRALRQHLRASDRVFRLGGEEFLLIMPGTTPAGVLLALAHLRDEWQTERPLPVSFSAGVAAVDQRDLSAAILAADGALYTAKEGGRDRFELAAIRAAADPTAVPSVRTVRQ